MEESNKIIQGLWIGNTLTMVEQLCIKSYLANGHDFHLYIYESIENVPKHTTLLDANQIISRENIFLDSEASYGAFSDWFRYMLLYEKGGWWVDMDNVCLKPYDFNMDFCFSSEVTEYGLTVTTGIIKSPPKAEFLKDCLSFIDEIKSDNVQWGTFGPSLLKIILSNYDHQKFLHPPTTFCPVYYGNFNEIFEQNIIISDETHSIHLWNEMWRRNNIDKNANFPQDSTLERLKKVYC